MILHRYLDEYGLNSLSDCELKVSIPSEFNDPFEGLPKDTGTWTRNKTKRKLFNRNNIDEVYQTLKSQGSVLNKKVFKKRLDKKALIDNLLNKYNSGLMWEGIQKLKAKGDDVWRIICFASSETTELDQILLWSHYTNKHKGIRFHFDSTKLLYNSFEIKKIVYSTERSSIDTTLEPNSLQFGTQILQNQCLGNMNKSIDFL